MPRLKLYLIRHSLSCANLAQVYCKWFLKKLQKSWSCQDPVLATWPFFSDRDPAIIKEIDLLRAKLATLRIQRVLSSCLLRAMETAHALFPTAKITPVPYIAEHGPGYDNVALAWEQQQAILLSKYAKDLTWIDQSYVSFCPQVDKVNFAKFLKFVKDGIVPPGDETYSVAVVTHSHFMKSIFEQLGLAKETGWKQIRNNSVYLLEYDLLSLRLLDKSVIHTGFAPPDKFEPWFVDRCETDCKDLVTSCSKSGSRD